MQKSFHTILINPSWVFQNGNIGAIPDLYPPLGLACVASALRQIGYSVSIADMPMLRMKEHSDDLLVEHIRPENPSVIGLTAVTMTYSTVVRLARRLRNEFPDAAIVVGGVHVNSCPDDVLREEAFDYSIAGQGELATQRLWQGLRAGQVGGDIPGVGYHRADVPYRQPKQDFDLGGFAPTAYDLFDIRKYRRGFKKMAVMTSRGCNARCVFCTSGYVLPRVKFLPVDRVLNELKYLVDEVGFKYINIYDSNFTYNKKRVHEICDKIIENNLKFKWRCFSKANGVDFRLFDKMRAAGCTHVLFGVETAKDETLKKIRKGNFRRHTEQAFREARRAGLCRIAYSIVGLPGESREDVLETIRFLENIDAEFNVVSPISLMPGTPLHDDMNEFGMVVTEENWERGSRGEVTATNGLLSEEEINELVNIALERLNNGQYRYDWHKVVANDPSICPHAAMMAAVR
ncbi:B12-binding domain-containing radical SAM protein [Roseibium alexandrii]|uniref:B12-binding domain-containing radical SAM protein n=1 Tax=Roseibium alexandrii TaxID=388408 RepID=UPI003752587F